MKDEDRTEEQPAQEPAQMRLRIAELEAAAIEGQRVERALRESEERLRSVFEAAKNVSFVTTDLQGTEARILDFSPGAEHIFGYSREEVVGRPLAILHVRECVDRFPEVIEACRQRRAGVTGEMELVRKSGERFPALVTCLPIFDAHGDMIKVLGVSIDITERKRAEQALRESEERFRLLVETAFDGINICELDPVTIKRRLVFCNDRYVEISGYTREELANADDLNQLLDVSWSREERQRQYDCIIKGVPFTGTASWMRPDGRENTYEFSAVSLKVGEKYHIIGVDRDVTERKRAEEALRESEERLRSVLESTYDVSYKVNLKSGTFEYISPSIKPLFGYDPEEVADLDFHEVLERVHPEDREGLTRHFAQLVHSTEGAAAPRVRFRFGHKSGEYRWYSDDPTVIRDEEGQPAAIVGIVRDITERKRAEQALRESEERFRLLVETAFDGINICEFDPATNRRRLIFCNDRHVEMSGYTRDELQNADDLNRLIRPYPTVETVEDVHEHIEDEESFRGVASWIRPDGKDNIYEFSAASVKMGDKYHLLGVDRDITERVKAEEALRDSEERYRTLVENVNVGVCRTTAGASGRYLQANAALARIYGYDSVEELMKVPVREVYHSPEDRMALLEELRAEGVVKSKVVRALRKDGTAIWASVTATAVFSDHRALKWIDMVIEDVTERKEAEERMVRRAESLRRQLAERYDMVGESEPMRAVYRFIRRAAPTEAGVLICGESGTGKELVAHAIHDYSRRGEGPLEMVNCAAMPPALMESELFGHVRGAFTGAVAAKAGRFELADGGTLFLDEVVELPRECQTKLLRVLEERKVRRLGDTQDRTVDVRLIAATNRRPDEAVAKGQLREDLFYRLDRLRIVVPPLRGRGKDIELLAEHFLEQISSSCKRTVKGFDPEVLAIFRSYGWPGNVRELQNVVERMVILGDGRLLGTELIPDDLKAAARPGTRGGVMSLGELERRQIQRALRQSGGNKTKAARMLGIDRSTLYAKLKRYGVGY